MISQFFEFQTDLSCETAVLLKCFKRLFSEIFHSNLLTFYKIELVLII